MYSENSGKAYSTMSSKLTSVGIVWAFVSFISSGLACTGFYLPFWLQGKLHNNTDTYFGTFRQCNFPRLDSETGRMRIVEECGRYTTFHDIPSVYWQVVTVLVGVGAGLLVVVGFMAILACCINDVISPMGSKIAGTVQFIAGLLIATGCCLYPNGWDSHEVILACGPEAGPYKLGECTLSWAYYVTIGAAATSLLSTCLSFHASHRKSTNIS